MDSYDSRYSPVVVADLVLSQDNRPVDNVVSIDLYS